MPKWIYLEIPLSDDKQAYINQIENKQKAQDDRIALVKAIPFENRFNKKLWEFTADEREEMYKNFRCAEKSLRKHRKAYIDYIRWIGKDSSVFEEPMTRERILQYNETVLTVPPEKLEEWLLNPKLDSVDHFLLTAPYYGIYDGGNEILNLKWNDISSDGITIPQREKGKVIPWNELLKAAVEELKIERDLFPVYDFDDYVLSKIRTMFGLRVRYERIKVSLNIPKNIAFGMIGLWYNGMLNYIDSKSDLKKLKDKPYSLVNCPGFEEVKERFNIFIQPVELGTRLSIYMKTQKLYGE